MAPERRNEIILGVLAVILAAVAYRAWNSPTTEPAAGGAPAASRAEGPHAAATAGPSVTQVHLDALDAERPAPESKGRDLFRFKPKAPPPPPPAASRPVTTAPPASTGPPPPPAVPPIALKFIGRMDQDNGKPTLGVFSDGVGPPMVGPEGGVLDGRYRILKIGAESAEIAYLDGRGRTTLRLSGG